MSYLIWPFEFLSFVSHPNGELDMPKRNKFYLLKLLIFYLVFSAIFTLLYVKTTPKMSVCQSILAGTISATGTLLPIDLYRTYNKRKSKRSN
jgi:uncharacterized membrane protein YagU involved in acid resistance